MNTTLRKITVCIALSGLAAAGILVGCRGNYDGTSGGDFLASGRTSSFFTALQIDPPSEDSAGPQFVVAEDLNADGLLDLVTAWNQSQPIQLHLQRRSATGSIGFETITLAGSVPAVAVAGLAVTDFDQDGRLDIVVMLKDTLLSDAGCLDSEDPGDAGLNGVILIYLGPADVADTNQSLAWREVPVESSRLRGTGTVTGFPEEGGFTGMAVGDIDLDGDQDIVAAWNAACGDSPAQVVLFTNQGGAAVRDRTWTGVRLPNAIPAGEVVKDVQLGDIDQDGDLDIVVTYPSAASMNVRWFRNPVIDVADEVHVSDGNWHVGTVGQVATSADIIRLADLDRDGRLDVVVRSSSGGVIQWLKGRGADATTDPLGIIPWQVFTLAEFSSRQPDAMALGDLNGDGVLELIVAAEGGLAWFDALGAPSVFDQWTENVIIDDQRGDIASTDPSVDTLEARTSTFINSILVVDLDGDGATDIITTLDRSGLSGLSNDALVWFRNSRGR